MEKKILFHDAVIVDDDLWCVDYYLPAIFRINLKSHRIEFVKVLPSNDNWTWLSCGAMAVYEDKLLIAPGNSKYIVIFCVRNLEIERLIDVTECVKTNINQLFSDVIVVGKSAYFLPGRSRVILKVNLEDYSYEIVDGWFELIESNCINNGRILCERAICDDGIIYMPLFQGGGILCVDTKTAKFRRVDIDDIPLTAIVKIEGGYVVSGRDKPVVELLDSEFKKYEEIWFDDFGDAGIFNIILEDDSIYAFPRQANRVLSYNVKNGSITEVLDLPKSYLCASGQIGEVSCMGVMKFEERLLFVSVKNWTLYVYDTVQKEGQFIKLQIEKSDFKILCNELSRLYPEAMDFIFEQPGYGLKELISDLKEN